MLNIHLHPTQTDREATECHLTNCTGSTLDPTKFNHWQLQNVLRIYVGRNFGWQRPNYKMSLGKIMLAIPTFSYFLTSDALDFVVLVLNYFPSQKELCSSFCSWKKVHALAFCSCAPYAFRSVSTKTICTTPPPLSEPRCICDVDIVDNRFTYGPNAAADQPNQLGIWTPAFFHREFTNEHFGDAEISELNQLQRRV